MSTYAYQEAMLRSTYESMKNIREDRLRKALKECLEIMRYYHKTPYQGESDHLDTCDAPEICGHCKAVKMAMEALTDSCKG